MWGREGSAADAEETKPLSAGQECEGRAQINDMVQKVLLLGIMGLAAWQDWKSRKVSVRLLFGAGCVGLFCFLYFRQIDVADMLLGAGVGAGLILIAWLTGEKIGYGDGALVLVSGIFLGFAENVQMLCMALLLTEVAALFLIVIKRKGRRYQIPFIPFLLAGYLLLCI